MSTLLDDGTPLRQSSGAPSRLQGARSTSPDVSYPPVALVPDLNRTPASGNLPPLAGKRGRAVPSEKMPVPRVLFGGMPRRSEDAFYGEGTQVHTQADGFSIDREPLFDNEGDGTQDMPTGAVKEDYIADEDDGNVTQVMPTGALAGEGLPKPKFSQRKEAYTALEDKMLCDAWMDISQDPICGAEQKGTAYWRKVANYFHKHRKISPVPFYSDRTELSLQKRWAFILAECNKFQGAYENVMGRQVSGMSIHDMVQLSILPTCRFAFMSIVNFFFHLCR